MGAPRFHVTTPLSPTIVGTEIALPDAVAHHAMRVLRMAVGEEIALFDGAGGEYAATLTRAGKREAWAKVEAFSPVERESPLAVTLVQAIAATDTMDAIVRRAVELGVRAVQPVVSRRSARFPDGPAGEKRLLHWRQVAVAACEQCGRNRVPEVSSPATLADWLARREPSTPGIVLDADASTSLASLAPPQDRVDLLLGPEGGLAPEEIDRSLRAGLRGGRMGPRVLRADTASLAALSAINHLWGDCR